jgi:hypothetical protein
MWLRALTISLPPLSSPRPPNKELSSRSSVRARSLCRRGLHVVGVERCLLTPSSLPWLSVSAMAPLTSSSLDSESGILESKPPSSGSGFRLRNLKRLAISLSDSSSERTIGSPAIALARCPSGRRSGQLTLTIALSDPIRSSGMVWRDLVAQLFCGGSNTCVAVCWLLILLSR